MLKEAKVTKDKTSEYPAAGAEQHFVDKHIKKDVNSKILLPDNGITNASSKVKTYIRKKDRMGNDEVESIKKYDENVYLPDKVKNAHKNKIKLRHIFDKSGNVLDTVLNAKNNKDAYSRFRNIAGKTHHDLAVVKEENETFKEGDFVHMGLKTKGGAGFRGHIKKIDEETGEVHLALPKDKHITFPRVIKGHISKCYKEEELVEGGNAENKSKKNTFYAKKAAKDDSMDKKNKFIKYLKKGRHMAEENIEQPIEEISKELSLNYIKKAGERSPQPKGFLNKIKSVFTDKTNSNRKNSNREAGIKLAARKLAGSDVSSAVPATYDNPLKRTKLNDQLASAKDSLKNSSNSTSREDQLSAAKERLKSNSNSTSREDQLSAAKDSLRNKYVSNKPKVKLSDIPKKSSSEIKTIKPRIRLKMTEETIEEISKGLAIKYINKAADQTSKFGKDAWNAKVDDFKDNPNLGDNEEGPKVKKLRDTIDPTWNKRSKGMKMASDKLTKEDLEVNPNIEYHVCTKDGAVKGKCNSAKTASRSKDRHDNAYGSYHHHVKYFDKEKKTYVKSYFKD